MTRSDAALKDDYKQTLQTMTPEGIADEAALYRGNGRHCGTTTSLILRWVRQQRPAEFSRILRLYTEAWDRIKTGRAIGAAECKQPVSKPVVRYGPRRRRRSSHHSLNYC